MPYITREDGVHFVIPSYRDVLASKNKTQLKKDILLLSQNYGEYITLQRKGGNQYEVAFSPDTGYLLGETVWHYFKKPLDLIYCEAIPNTTEALLVIVKGGSVYLDGSFPLDSIAEELIIFLTQKNNFEIYIYGDVPISETPVEGKFNLEPTSVKSFTILDRPVFSQLPLLKIYQLQLVEQVLRAQGIGVFPLRQLLIALALLTLLWLAFSYFRRQEVEILPAITAPPNPYQGYNEALLTPAPEQVLQEVTNLISLAFTMPGWTPMAVNYEDNELTLAVKSEGSKVADLNEWAQNNQAMLELKEDGIYLTWQLNLPKRSIPSQIYPLKEVIGSFVDRLASVYPGNRLKIKNMLNRGSYSTMSLEITVDDVAPVVLQLISQQFKDLPFVLKQLTLTVRNGNLSGLISLDALGK